MIVVNLISNHWHTFFTSDTLIILKKCRLLSSGGEMPLEQLNEYFCVPLVNSILSSAQKRRHGLLGSDDRVPGHAQPVALLHNNVGRHATKTCPLPFLCLLQTCFSFCVRCLRGRSNLSAGLIVGRCSPQLCFV